MKPTPTDNICRFTCRTKHGNILSFFYNPNNDLVVVDLVSADETGGNELLRKHLNEPQLLRHTEAEPAPESGNSGCDRCGVNDAESGSNVCHECKPYICSYCGSGLELDGNCQKCGL